MLRKTCVICHPRLSTWVTLGVALMLPLVLNAVPAIAAVTVEVTVSQQIYQPNAVQVKSNVTISGVKNTKGTLYVSTVKEQGEELVDERRYPITLDNDGIVTQPYDIAPLPKPDASYTILATFIEEDNTIAEAHARFGIRPEGFPAGVPDHILYTRVPSLSVPDILDRLEQGAKPSNKEPVELQIGSEVIKVRVEKQELLAKGVEIPNLGRPPVFAGQLIDEDGVEVPGSSVVFTVTNGQSGVMQLGGMVKTPVTGADTPPSAFDAMWIEPLER